jgi:uncharacterized membrane protein
MRKKGIVTLKNSIIACFIVLFSSVAGAYAGSLQEDFDRLCVYTQEAESLSLEKLQELVTECDQLQKRIEESNDEKKKLLLFRLQKCRNFFAYIIELKQGENSSSPQ